jgi:hypothetical protein
VTTTCQRCGVEIYPDVRSLAQNHCEACFPAVVAEARCAVCSGELDANRTFEMPSGHGGYFLCHREGH